MSASPVTVNCREGRVYRNSVVLLAHARRPGAKLTDTCSLTVVPTSRLRSLRTMARVASLLELLVDFLQHAPYLAELGLGGC
jgi:hypothetical protein